MSGRQIDATVVEAIHFATGKHRDQRRKDVHQSPFINHPVEAAHLLVKVGGVSDDEAIIAAVLHDTLEDTATTPAEIEQWFGKGVRQLVEDVTDPPNLSTNERRRRQLAQVRTASPRARLIRLADKVANLAALPTSWTPDQRHAYLTWMGEMAAALGGTNAPLEAVMAARLKTAWKSANRTPSAPRPEQSPEAPAAGLKPAFEDQLTKLVRRLQKQLSAAEELSDTLCDMLSCLGVNLVRPTPAAARPGPALANARKKPRLFADPIFEELARNGVGTVTFADGKTGFRMVFIDGAEPFELPIGAAELLEALVSVPGRTDDSFPPLVSHVELVAAIERMFGRRLAVHTLVVRLGRLREKLFLARWSPKLIETHPRRGVRFRLRRSKS